MQRLMDQVAIVTGAAQDLGRAFCVKYGICVNAIAPGFTMTDASRELIPDAEHYGLERGAIKRPEQAEDLVGTVAFLASAESDFITGQTIVIDRGRQFH